MNEWGGDTDAPYGDILETTLDQVLEADEAGDIPGTPECSHAIAAAETIAALAETPASSLPEEVRQWCFDNPGADLDEVQPKAVQALGVILQESGLRALFDSSGQVDEWEVEVESLRDRLRG